MSVIVTHERFTDLGKFLRPTYTINVNNFIHERD